VSKRHGVIPAEGTVVTSLRVQIECQLAESPNECASRLPHASCAETGSPRRARPFEIGQPLFDIARMTDDRDVIAVRRAATL